MDVEKLRWAQRSQVNQTLLCMQTGGSVPTDYNATFATTDD